MYQIFHSSRAKFLAKCIIQLFQIEFNDCLGHRLNVHEAMLHDNPVDKSAQFIQQTWEHTCLGQSGFWTQTFLWQKQV